MSDSISWSAGYRCSEPASTVLAYLLVFRVRCRTGWVSVAGIALIAWLAVLVVLYGF